MTIDAHSGTCVPNSKIAKLPETWANGSRRTTTKQRNYEKAKTLLSEQNFVAAVIAGAVATVLAAVIYSIVVARWSFSYGFAAAGIGIAIGISMQYLGRGIEMRFAVAAAVYTIAGCFLGNVFRVVSPLEVFRSNDFSLIAEQSVSDISVLRLWFSGLLLRFSLESFSQGGRCLVQKD
ncbi:MAG: hypothetical protein U5K76_01485 [Woeseiaceae bacterium]|nr:hypothetical protein [Woeseiaceae bacterium]